MNAENPFGFTPKPITCNDAVVQWLEWLSRNCARNTVTAYKVALDHLFRESGCRHRVLSWIDEKTIFCFVNGTETGLASRKMRLAGVRSFFHWANAKGYVLGNPAELIEVNYRMMTVKQIETVHHEPMSEEEYRRLIDCPQIPQAWRDMIVIAYCAGLRISDCACLEWESLKGEGLVIYPTKTRHKRLLLPAEDESIFRPELKEVIARLLVAPRKDEVFVWLYFAVTYDMNRPKLCRHFRCWAQVAGVEGRTFHCLRTAFARRLQAAGKTIYDVARAMGHGSVNTTAAYLDTTNLLGAYAEAVRSRRRSSQRPQTYI